MREYSLTICRGFPASGKSTWAKQKVIETPKTIRFNYDDLREMVGIGESDKYKEKIIKNMVVAGVKSAMNVKHPRNIIIDNLNLHIKSKGYSVYHRLVDDFNKSEDAHKAAVKYILLFRDFKTPFEECLKRNSERKTPVPESEMNRLFGLYKDFLTNNDY